ncbi:MAG: hypothetical protein AB7P69_05935 [Candidatus Binatia bacterium]
MAIRVDTHIERIDLATEPDVVAAIKEICDLQALRDESRRLAAACEAQNQLILIFQVAADTRTD